MLHGLMGGITSSTPAGGLGSRLGNFGKTIEDGFKSVFAPDQIAQGWRDVLHLSGPKPPVIDVPVTGDALTGGFMNGGSTASRIATGSRGGLSGGFIGRPSPVPPTAGGLTTGGSVPVAPGPVAPGPVAPGPVPPGPVPPGPEPVPGGATGGIRQGLAAIGSGMLKAARNSALISAVISTAVNGYKVLTGQEATNQAAGSIVADTVGGTVSGAVGAAASGLAIALAGTVGMTVGLPLTLVGIAGGLAGSILAGTVFKSTGLYDRIRNGIANMVGGRGLGGPVNRPLPGGTQPYPYPYPSQPMPGRTQPYPSQPPYQQPRPGRGTAAGGHGDRNRAPHGGADRYDRDRR